MIFFFIGKFSVYNHFKINNAYISEVHIYKGGIQGKDMLTMLRNEFLTLENITLKINLTDAGK